MEKDLQNNTSNNLLLGNDENVNNTPNSPKPKYDDSDGPDAFVKFCKNLYNKVLKKIYNLIVKIFKSPKWTFLLLSIILTLVMLGMIIVPVADGAFLNCYTDDLCQYFPYMAGFINKIKEGTLSFYDTTLMAGNSYFSGVYYIPLDFFILITLLLSYMMPVEIAYVATNILKIVCGALLIYYLFIQKGMKTKTAFMVAAIYFVGGATQTYLIFPVYIGICFYAPLAAVLIDLALRKNKYWWLAIPLYTFIVILYDFYIAYMLLAFLCVYFVVEYSITCKKKVFLADGWFYVNLIKLLGLILIGLAISMFYFAPSVFFVLNESNRSTQTADDCLWIFGTLKNGKLTVSWRHYFTQFTNLITPNIPNSLGLVKAGDYIREHASLYITSGGALFLLAIFLIKGKVANYLKIWVVIINIMFAMPIFAMIFTANGWPYVRWFFIPYLINLYAMAYAMDKNDFAIGKNKYVKLVPFAFLLFCLIILCYVLVNSPELFIHYDSNSYYFEPIVGGGIAFVVIYMALLITSFILNCYKKKIRLIPMLIPVVILAEIIFAFVFIVDSFGGYDYIENREALEKDKDVLVSMGFNANDGYRLNLFTSPARGQTNVNTMIGNANHTDFFQSFFNYELDSYYKIIHNDQRSGWNRRSIYGYSPISGSLFNVKYIASDWDCGNLRLPEQIYTPLESYDYSQYYPKMYYMANDMPSFIVYDTVYALEHIGQDLFYKDLSLLFYGVVEYPSEFDKAKLDTKKDKDKIKVLDTYNKIFDTNVKTKTDSAVIDELKAKYPTIKVHKSGPDYYEIGDAYAVYKVNSNSEMKKLYNKDAIIIYQNNYIYEWTDKNYAKADDIHTYFVKRGTEGDAYYPFHYNVGYTSCFDFEPDDISIRMDKDKADGNLSFYGFDYDFYTDYINSQNEYTNRYFNLNKETMTIRFTNKDNSAKIIKTAYTYSDDWKILNNNDGYETVRIDGGFLGIIVPEDISDISLKLKYVPAGYETGLKVSAAGCIIYLGITTPILVLLVIKKRKNKKGSEVNEDDINSSSLL